MDVVFQKGADADRVFANLHICTSAWAINGSTIRTAERFDLRQHEGELPLGLCIAVMGGNARDVMARLRGVPPRERRSYVNKLFTYVVCTYDDGNVKGYTIRDVSFTLRPAGERVPIRKVWRAKDPLDN